MLRAPVLAGHAIGVIVADTEAAAQAAARAVEVTYTDIAPVLSIEQAIEAGSYFEVLTLSLRVQGVYISIQDTSSSVFASCSRPHIHATWLAAD